MHRQAMYGMRASERMSLYFVVSTLVDGPRSDPCWSWTMRLLLETARILSLGNASFSVQQAVGCLCPQRVLVAVSGGPCSRIV